MVSMDYISLEEVVSGSKIENGRIVCVVQDGN